MYAIYANLKILKILTKMIIWLEFGKISPPPVLKQQKH